MRPENFQQQFGATGEAMDRLRAYHALLLKWQKAINLVSGATLAEAWARHFADSAQLAGYIPPTARVLADLGSGAGFPGMVLAIMRPDIETHLIESDGRKAEFLRTVSRETTVGARVHDRRIEEAAAGLSPDVVTARALAPLPDLLGFCADWAAANPALTMLFLKGQAASQEIEFAREKYDFAVETIPSLTQGGAGILRISGLRQRG